MDMNLIRFSQNIYTHTKFTKNQNQIPASLALSDTTEISSEGARQAKIAAFLKDKPYSAYKYEWMQRNESEQADKFIDDLIKNYDMAGGKDSLYPVHPKQKDIFAVNLEFTSKDELQEGIEQEITLDEANSLAIYLLFRNECKERLESDKKAYSRDLATPKNASILNRENDIHHYKYYQDKK